MNNAQVAHVFGLHAVVDTVDDKRYPQAAQGIQDQFGITDSCCF